MTLVGLDPSLESAGVAIFVGRNLRACARVTDAGMPDDRREPGMRSVWMARAIERWVMHQHEIFLNTDKARCAVVYERPQIYKVGKSLVDPNKVIPLAEIGAGVACLLHASDVRSPTPAEWSDGTSKTVWDQSKKKRIKPKDPWATTRGSRLKGQLTPMELTACREQNHDVLDAICIGLWALDRWRPARIYPGAI